MNYTERESSQHVWRITEPVQRIIFETKHVVSRRSRNLMLGLLRHYTSVPRKFSHAYLRTIYFDDPSGESYHESRDGQLKKRKFRLREYINPEEGGAEYSLEVKKRSNNMTSKVKKLIFKRLPADYRMTTFSALVGTFEDLNCEVFTDLRMELPHAELLPVTCITYERFRFDDYRIDARYNLDINITVYPLVSQGFHGAGGFCLENDIFEIKSSKPDLFPGFIQNVDLLQVSFSKYVWGSENVP